MKILALLLLSPLVWILLHIPLLLWAKSQRKDGELDDSDYRTLNWLAFILLLGLWGIAFLLHLL